MRLLMLMLSFVVTTGQFSTNQDDDAWNEFKRRHNKTYSSSMEEILRKQNYFDNNRHAERHNRLYRRGFFTFSLGLNKYADWPSREFNRRLNSLRVAPRAGMNLTLLNAIKTYDAPDQFNWTNAGIITPVKDQGECGSCWAFSVTGSLEGQHARKTGKLVSLSEQNLMDCNRNAINEGCEGGVQDEAFRYIKQNSGIDTETAYPYQGLDGLPCRFSRNNVGANDKGFQDIPEGSEDVLKKAVAKIGPIAVGMDASGVQFQLYQQGIYYNPLCSSSNLNHAVLVVGYGNKNSTDYWLVKNSYGKSWGMKGYFKIVRNMNNHCGIATQASFPLV